MVVANAAFERVMETTDQWIEERTGIRERRFVDPGTAASDLGVEAARAALEDAGVEASEVDYIVCAVMTPDYYFPGSGGLIQHKLGIDPVPCLDIRQQCAGYAFGLQMVDVLIRSGAARTVLLIGTDVHSSMFPFSERTWSALTSSDGRGEAIDRDEYEWNSRYRNILVLFGDGAGAMVFRADEGGDDRGILGHRLRTDGGVIEALHMPGVGSLQRPMIRPGMYETGEWVPQMDGRTVFRLAVTKMPEVTLELLAGLELSLDQLDLLVMHQANLRINDAAQKALGLPDDKVFNNIQSYGNTTSATLPIAFHEARQAGRARQGDLVAFAALGAGLNWGAVLMRV
ncbi:MAG: 3-oxoacyl-ACP synthase [Acidobacteria bacterium]|nr:MAG: 3-oxoacyl-ACP synthase [Acidobacteriota bacterium]REK00236.1 MAG: 3-oxoacyl-ACP synthase [Acidobacteriota bacterium]